MKNPKAQWKECDADGAGKVLFDEFANWAIKKNLDLDDDDDVTDSDIEVQKIDRMAQNKQYLADYRKAQAAKAVPKRKKYNSSIWAELKQRLPWEKNATHEKQREELWRAMDANVNGMLSLAEFEKGLQDVIKLPQLFQTKPVLIRAFNAAKGKVKSKSSKGDEYIEKSEFRYLLKYLRQYYEYWVAFDLIDLDGDRRLTFKEFKLAAPQISQWNIDMSNPEAQWKKCDADGGGKVLFDEFANWAIK